MHSPDNHQTPTVRGADRDWSTAPNVSEHPVQECIWCGIFSMRISALWVEGPAPEYKAWRYQLACSNCSTKMNSSHTAEAALEKYVALLASVASGARLRADPPGDLERIPGNVQEAIKMLDRVADEDPNSPDGEWASMLARMLRAHRCPPGLTEEDAGYLVRTADLLTPRGAFAALLGDGGTGKEREETFLSGKLRTIAARAQQGEV